MARFDWLAFLKRHRIDYKTKGPGTSRGNVYCVCPFCQRAGDESAGFYRMGISLDGRGWGCWRTTEHRGIRPHLLVQALLKCSYAEAAAIVGDDAGAMPAVSDRTFGSFIKTLCEGPAPQAKPSTPLVFPGEIKPIKEKAMFLNYMVERGYTVAGAKDAARLYGLRYALNGPFRYRLVFPVEHEEGLVCWTGRSVYKGAELRYRALSADAEKAKKDHLPQARRSIDKCLWQSGALMSADARTLAVCEGPFDAMRLDYVGRHHGLRATCVFGKNISDSQIEELDKLAPRFRRRLLMLDKDALMESLGKVQRLEFLGFTISHVPAGVKDPALMSERQVIELAKGTSTRTSI